MKIQHFMALTIPNSVTRIVDGAFSGCTTRAASIARARIEGPEKQ
jgi:hypothetical protein